MSDLYGASLEVQERRLTDLAVVAAGCWGLGSDCRIELLKHRENAVFSVQADAGRYAMRVHRSGYHTDAELESELAWISALRNDDFRTPLVVPSADGRTMIRVSTPGVPEERQVDVVEWFDGSPLGESEGESLTDTDDVVATFTVIGELMAATHNHSERWERPSFFTRQVWDEDGIPGCEPVGARTKSSIC